MNEAASELQGTFNEFILFAIYYEMCNKSQTVYFFVPIMVNFGDKLLFDVSDIRRALILKHG